MTTVEEVAAESDPYRYDTDMDDLTDRQELQDYKTSPVKADTDGDGITDGGEVNVLKTDPLVRWDRNPDGTAIGGDPALNQNQQPQNQQPGQRNDRDGDGLFDDDETNVYGTNPGRWRHRPRRT